MIIFNIPVFPDSYGNELLPSVKTKITSTDIRIGYLINPKINRNLKFQIFIRDYKNSEICIPTKMAFSLNTDLFNAYYDF